SWSRPPPSCRGWKAAGERARTGGFVGEGAGAGGLHPPQRPGVRGAPLPPVAGGRVLGAPGTAARVPARAVAVLLHRGGRAHRAGGRGHGVVGPGGPAVPALRVRAGGRGAGGPGVPRAPVGDEGVLHGGAGAVVGGGEPGGPGVRGAAGGAA